MAPLYPEFAPVAIIASLLVLLPLPWHWRARNVATLSMIFWFFVSNVTFAVDAIVWGDNVNLAIPVWCDITTKLMIGANIALPASCLCISMYLEQIASLRNAQWTLADRRKRQWFEAFMGFGLPIIFMVLHIIVQGHRFDIIEGYGCRPTTYFSIPAIFIVWIPPLLMAIGSMIFSGLALRHFIIRRLTFAAHLQASKSALTTSRYLRLVAMASVQIVGSITITSYNVWFTSMAIPIRPWTNWADVHSDFGRIDQFPIRFTPKIVQSGFYVVWWMVPIPTFLFVTFFAFGNDAIEEYKKCFLWIKEKVFRQSKSGEFTKAPKGFSFVKFSNSNPTVPPISKPVLQSTTSSDYTLPPYESTARMTMSSLYNTVTTLHEPESTQDEYKYHLRESTTSIGSSTRHNLGIQPKAIGSYSDLSVTSPTVIDGTPSEATFRGDSVVKDKFSPLPPLPEIASPTPVGSRLRPFLLMGGRQQPQNEGARRPLTYPSSEAEWWSVGAPFGHGVHHQA